MARELSQAELLDFLCQAGGRVANAALVGHFRRFLRDPQAAPGELQRRRELFKGFVNSVATVRQEGPGAAKYVVLRKRYRELVGEEPKPHDDAPPPPPPPPPRARPLALAGTGAAALALPQGRARGGRACRREAARRPGEEERPRRAPAAPLPALAGSPPLSPRRRPPAPLCLRGGAPQSPGPPSPVGAMGAPPSLGGGGGAQQRIRDWVVAQQQQQPPPVAAPRRQEESAAWLAGQGPPSPTAAPLDSPLEPPPPPSGPRLPVFRSIRCQLSLQDLEDFLEQESSASEEGSSASGGSDSGRLEGDQGRRPLRLPPRGPGRPGGPSRIGDAGAAGSEGPHPGLHEARGAGGSARESMAQQNGPVPGHLALLSQVAGRANKPWGKEAERESQDPPTAKKAPRPPLPNLEAPLSPRPVSRQGHAANRPDLEGLVPDTDGSTEHRSSLVPLEPREHAWLVKVATGSWMQARALLLEDPHLATRKDFISGYTVLHWLAKHGNAQVLQDFVAGARKAGVPLDVNVKSGCGYTPLHLAAMHGHQLVIKVLVQTLQCHVQVRDSSGKRPWQYLSSTTSGEVWQLLGAPRGKTIFPARPITRSANFSPARKGKSPELARKISRTASLAAYLKPQHIKWKMGNKCPPLHEREEYSD